MLSVSFDVTRLVTWAGVLVFLRELACSAFQYTLCVFIPTLAHPGCQAGLVGVDGCVGGGQGVLPASARSALSCRAEFYRRHGGAGSHVDHAEHFRWIGVIE